MFIWELYSIINTTQSKIHEINNDGLLFAFLCVGSLGFVITYILVRLDERKNQNHRPAE
jgi:hypothetical protein